jgi:hypothetical protein
MKKGGIGGVSRLNGIFTAMGARRLHHYATACVCVCNDPSSVEGAIDFAKRNPPSQALGRTYLRLASSRMWKFWSCFQQRPGRI